MEILTFVFFNFYSSFVNKIVHFTHAVIAFGSHRGKCLNQIKGNSYTKNWTVTIGTIWTNTFAEILNLMSLSR